MEKDIEVRLRREHIENGVKGRPTDFWIIYDSNSNFDRFIGDSEIVRHLDDIFQNNLEQEARDSKITQHLQMSGILSEERKLRSYWLPPVDDALSAPVKLFFNPSGRCPNNCLTCFAEELTTSTLDDQVAREAFDQAVKMPIFWMNLGGCELAFYDLYFEFAEKSLKNGIHTSTAISGVALEREWAEQARDIGIKIKVSLDGPKRINDVQRPGTYEAAIDAIRLFREIGYPVKMNMVHTKHNNDEKVIDEMFEIAKANGATGIDISVCRPKGGALKNDLMIPLEDYENGKVASVIKRFLTHPYITEHGIKVWINKNVRTLDCLDAKPCQATNIHCNGGRYSMGINNNGLVDACIFLPNHYIPKANVNDPGLFQDPNFVLNIWQNDQTFKKVREYTKGEVCSNCRGKGIEFVRGCKALEAYYKGTDPSKLLH